jgi:hypothetical protein
MSVLNENTIIGASGAGGDYEIDQSLRFNDDDTPYLSFQPSSASNRKTYTFSFWFKRATQTNESPIFTSNQGHEPGFNIMFGGHLADDYELNVYDYTSGSANIHLRTTQKFRDSSAWYHIAIAVDTTQGTAANRAKIYVNGNQVTSFATETYPSQNLDTNMNNPAQTSGKTWSIGSATERGEYTDGYLAEFNFIDGLALTPDSFGETGDYGEWKPIAYAGTYGTNGFYLPFEQDYAVEGFSTVTYEGNSSTNHYVGGTGFSPDVVWIKARSSAYNHQFYDSVRGANEVLETDTTNADETRADGLLSFDTDGFSLGSQIRSNNSGQTYVAWNWDMGGTTASNTSGSITSSVRANTTYGQSIVSWTGNGLDNVESVGHGLNSKPEMVIVKDRAATYNWYVDTFIDGVPDKHLELNTTGATNSWEPWSSTSATLLTSIGNAGTGWWTNNTNAQIAYCFHSVTGYSKFGSYSGSGSSGNAITTGFAPAFVMVKRTDSAQDWQILDNTRDPNDPRTRRLEPNNSDAEVNDTSYNNCNFTSTGFTWQADGGNTNASGGTYIYMAFADTREYAYWYDQSGNNNDWTSEGGLTESDVMLDSPTNNFATFNPLVSLNSSFSEGNLKTTTPTVAGNSASTIAVSAGKWYVEFVCTENVTTGSAIGVLSADDYEYDSNIYEGGNLGIGYYSGNGSEYDSTDGVSGGNAYGSSWTVGDIMGAAYDADGSSITFYKNNVSQGTLSLDSSISSAYFACGEGQGADTATFVANFGQDSSFAGNKTPQGNQDSNGIGDFYYAPPNSYLSLCTSNLPSVDVIPSEHFNTVTWTGDASYPRSFNAGFQTDFLWIKSRSYTGNGIALDTIRGSTKALRTSTTGAETTNTFATFDSEGFNITATFNESNETTVAWNWKAGGSASSNTNGTITSSVSANPSAGFSIVSYTGNATSGATVGHGLSAKPEMIIVKARESATNWIVYNKLMGATNYHYLNTTLGNGATSIFWNNTEPTASLVTLGNNAAVNDNAKGNIMYAFHSVDGYSKVGSYIGNGSTDGTFVHCGFRPAYVMVKRTNSTGNWVIYDNKRSGFNVDNDQLQANLSDTEYDGATYAFIDLLASGFKLRSSGADRNASGGTYIFLAFAESPFKHSNAR